jgi:hypothetical protein
MSDETSTPLRIGHLFLWTFATSLLLASSSHDEYYPLAPLPGVYVYRIVVAALRGVAVAAVMLSAWSTIRNIGGVASPGWLLLLFKGVEALSQRVLHLADQYWLAHNIFKLERFQEFLLQLKLLQWTVLALYALWFTWLIVKSPGWRWLLVAITSEIAFAALATLQRGWWTFGVWWPESDAEEWIAFVLHALVYAMFAFALATDLRLRGLRPQRVGLHWTGASVWLALEVLAEAYRYWWYPIFFRISLELPA